MLRKTLFIIIAVAVFAVSIWYLQHNGQNQHASKPTDGPRIISLSPSLTDSLFTLGLGENVVGVTSYCYYPPEARTRPIVGNLYDHNLELILKLKPDIIVLNTGQEKNAQRLNALGIPTVIFDNRRIEDVLNTFTRLGQMFGREAEAAAITTQMRREFEYYRELTASLPKVRTMVSVGRGMGSMTITQSYAVGPTTYIGVILEYAGGENVYKGQTEYPILTTEALLRLNPEAIIELAPEVNHGAFTANDVLRQWEPLQELDAVRNGRLYVLSGDYVVMPGPKMIFLLRDMLNVLHPELEIGNNG